MLRYMRLVVPNCGRANQGLSLKDKCGVMLDAPSKLISRVASCASALARDGVSTEEFKSLYISSSRDTVGRQTFTGCTTIL